MNPSDKGRLTRAEGELFEKVLIAVAKSQWIRVIKIPSGSRSIGHNGRRPILVPAKTPFDFVMAKQGRAAFFDAKSVGTGNFTHARITEHQIRELTGLEEAGFVAGYIVHFREKRVVRFFKASELAKLKPRESLKPNDGIDLGTSDLINLNYLFRKELHDQAIDGAERESASSPGRKQTPEARDSETSPPTSGAINHPAHRTSSRRSALRRVK